MEMEFKDGGRRRRVLMITLGLLLAVGAGWGAYTLATNGTARNAEVEMASVLMASRDIMARTPITADDLVVRSMPVDQVLDQAYRETGLVVGRVTAVPVYANQQITPNLFATTAADAEFSILGPDEVVDATSPFWRAVAVSVPPERAVGGEITPGQRVDLIISVDFTIYAVDESGNYIAVDGATAEGLMSGKSTKITIQDLEVLQAAPAENMYVLKVDLHEAEQIAHVIQVSPEAMTLVLRPDEDTRPADAAEYGETTDSMVMTYLFRVPQLADLEELLGYPITPTAPTVTPAPDEPANPDESPDPDETAAPDTTPPPDEEPTATPSL